jgi:hypothetical protein
VTDTWVPAPPQPAPPDPPASLPPANTWSPVTPCAAADDPRIADGVIITGRPAVIQAMPWQITVNDGGSPANFTIDHYDATGALIEHPILIDGDSGDVMLTHDPTQPLGVATKDYVDNRGGLQDAPQNGFAYGRNDAAWVVVAGEAPVDAQLYARSLRAWVAIPYPISDAPNDGNLYGRASGAWATAYSTTNPANYQTALQVTAVVAPLMPRSGGNFTGGVGFTAGAVFTNLNLLNIQGGAAGQMVVSSNPTSGILGWATPLSEAPNDGQQYARQSLGWSVITGGGGGIADAPNDGTAYARKSAAWAHLSHTDITDWTATLAPYALTTALPVASTNPPSMDGNSQVGTSTAYARADHVHPSDISRFVNANRLINGDMVIGQRAPMSANPAVPGYTVDRWRYDQTVAARGQWDRPAATAGSAMLAAGLSYCLRWTTAATAYTLVAADYFTFSQHIEGINCQDFGWGTAGAQPITLSFWVNSWTSGPHSGAVRDAAGTRSYPFTYGVATANTWQKITIVIPGDTGGTWAPTTSAAFLRVSFDLGSGTTFRSATANTWQAGNFLGVNGNAAPVVVANATWSVARVKLELGPYATPWVHQTYRQALADCQRYYQAGGMQLAGWCGAASMAFANVFSFPTPMRASPTLTPNWTLQQGGTASLIVTGATGYQVGITAAVVGPCNVSGTFTADAEL